MIKAVFLDIDDTLLSFQEYTRQAMREGFAKFGIGTYTEDMFPLFHQYNGELWRAIERGELTYERLLKIRWNYIFERLGLSGDGEAFEDYFKGELFHNAIVIPGAMELLEYLRGKVLVCAASNGPDGQQQNRLKISGMMPYFDALFISEEIGVSKPSPAYFDECFRRLSALAGETILPEETLILGDSMTSDIGGGAAYGLKTCLYRPEYEGEPLDPKPDYIITDLREMREILPELLKLGKESL